MTVLCNYHIDALWVINESANAWVWLRNRGWRKLDNSSTQMCMRLLALAKACNVPISLHEEQRGTHVTVRISLVPDIGITRSDDGYLGTS